MSRQRGLTSARPAEAVHRKVVLSNSEIRWYELADIVDAACDVEHTRAFLALKMVVVSLVSEFISYRLSRDRYCLNYIVFQ
jgi:hypothetical protein